MKEIGQGFRDLRKLSGFTLKDVCNMTNNIISASTLSDFENGKCEIKLSVFNELLKLFNINYNEFNFICNNYPNR